MVKRPINLTIALLFLMVVGYVTFFTLQLYLHYHSFGSRSLDLGSINQAIWNTLHGRPFHQTNQPGVNNRLSLHVEPILIPISLLYLVYSGPEILFIFQSIIVALGAIPVFALARFKLSNEGLALVFALVYLLFPAIQAATLLDFHAVTLAPTFLLAAFYYLETQRPKQFTLFAILAAACKEEIALLVMMMGFYALFFKRQRRLGLVTITLAGVWALLAVFVIPPLFAGTQNIHWNRYSHLGESPLTIILNLILQPHLFLNHLQQVKALVYFGQLLTPTAFTALLSPVTLLLALPSLGINLLSSFPPMQRVNSLIYAAPIVPAILISSIYGVANLMRMSEWIRQRFGQTAMMRPLSKIIGSDTSPFILQALIASLIMIAALGYHIQYGYLPWGGQFRGWEEITDHHRRAADIIAQIPPDAALSAHDRLNPHVSQRETLYIFDRIDDADYIVLDITEDSWPLHPIELLHRVDNLVGNGFGIVDAFDGYLLLANSTKYPQLDLAPTLPDAFFDFARVSNPDAFYPQFPASVTFDHKLRLLGYDIRLGAHEQFLPVVTLYWQALESLEQDYALSPFIIDRNGQIIEDQTERPLVATLWYPTSRWSPSEIIMTSTLPWDLGDEFTVAVGITDGTWSDVSQRLPITHADSFYTFENGTWVRLGTFRRSSRHSYEAVTVVDQIQAQPQQPLQAQFWNKINLQGVDLSKTLLKPGGKLPLTLYWLTNDALPVDLTTFVHLLDDDGNVAAQLDWIPQDKLGYLPTTAWQPNRLVIDSQIMVLPDEISPGQYRLAVGWYYSVTGDRLPLTSSHANDDSQDMVQLGRITIR